MITNIYLKNFRGFTEINASFMETATKSKNYAFIYGENGIGKSNLFKAITFLQKLSRTRFNEEKLLAYQDIEKESFREFISSNYPTVRKLINNYKRKGSFGEFMIVKIDFDVHGKKGSYEIKTNDEVIVSEELKYDKFQRISTVYSFNLNKEKDWFDDNYIFLNEKSKEDMHYDADKYRGNHSFLSIFLKNLQDVNKDFIISNFNGDFVLIILDLINIKVIDNTEGHNLDNYFIQNDLLTGHYSLENKQDNELLAKREIELSKFFCSIYKNVVKVVYFKEIENNKVKYDLYFIEKDQNDKLVEIKYNLLSSGTLKLFQIFSAIKSFVNGETVFIDEIDSGVHDLLMKEIISKVIDYAKDFPVGQLICTTHNTLLMKNIKATNIYVLINKEGHKIIVPLSSYGTKIQTTTNKTKQYLDGAYGGKPIVTLNNKLFKSLIDK